MEKGAPLRCAGILLTGPPGIGKTTICQSIVRLLRECGLTCNGFYTEEVRAENHQRLGFNVIPVNNDQGSGDVLARIDSAPDKKVTSKRRVGPYQVFIDKFEKIALPALNSSTDVMIIDEIGKMELFSKPFEKVIQNIFFSKTNCHHKFIIATIPAKDRVPIRHKGLFDRFYEDKDYKIVEVDRKNRDGLPSAILDTIKHNLQ